ncbi:MAG: methyltransferase, partial [Dehalococcoidia bacterium]|nr:methyltransferase [Dehalococcoidia bacterium]
MPIMPNFIERLILFKLNLAPGVMLDMLGAAAFLALSTALKLGIFETLSGGPMTSTEIARKIEADERGTVLLLEAVEALGYVKKRKDTWANTAMTTKWLLRLSPNCLASGFALFESLLERWRYLADSIRLGKPVMLAWDWLDQNPGRWRDYQAAMLAMARMVSDDVVSKVKLASTARRLLDVGGGHGLYSIKFCRRYPTLSATVFDWPQSLDVARETIDA